MATSVLRDHEYEQDLIENPGRLSTHELARPEESQSSASHSSDSERARDEPKVSGSGGEQTHIMRKAIGQEVVSKKTA
ncbi:hypothetical protein NDU88_001618 [Pleurodeles waltl]|uniref:Uncharacterized protein n=1 Tax=Pleurodeles waltl TaxID=8319 RepID=A0AAV7S8J0_PLEWA|nr:hypothetical protein NDU88_001618 [Pleurodeles waltl]